jgi:hypothetical protein
MLGEERDAGETVVGAAANFIKILAYLFCSSHVII